MENKDFQCSSTIEKYTGNDTVVEILAEINGVPVTEIGESAFQDCWSLKEIKIPDSVKIIGDDILKGCENLKRVYINTSNWSYADIQRIFGKNPPFEILPLE